MFLLAHTKFLNYIKPDILVRGQGKKLDFYLWSHQTKIILDHDTQLSKHMNLLVANQQINSVIFLQLLNNISLNLSHLRQTFSFLTIFTLPFPHSLVLAIHPSLILAPHKFQNNYLQGICSVEFSLIHLTPFVINLQDQNKMSQLLQKKYQLIFYSLIIHNHYIYHYIF